ncbi:killer cell lectin-like receptor subfamily F member 1 [Varanus komodoensis]|uniref:killer cell lectin-like receptor subfamily F member 1 n=1 Tax=Varanus komodoensis TaxID=61221 RepID=UPI001CF7E99C|nr:killer cell lectin-like receptor subfamily F member 1 [Varanus komodoensis]
MKCQYSHSVSALLDKAEQFSYPAIRIGQLVKSPLKGQRLHWCLRWYRIALGITCAMILLLTGGLIALTLLILQSKGTSNVTNGTSCLVAPDPCLRLKHFLCSSADNTAEFTNGCKLCPVGWTLHKDNCYWFSKGKKNWTQSHNDCRAKNSSLPVLQTQEEMDFITKKADTVIWLGLRTSHSGRCIWEWVDGSPFRKELFSVSGPAEEHSCAMKRKNVVASETCNALSSWACKKNAFPIQAQPLNPLAGVSGPLPG